MNLSDIAYIKANCIGKNHDTAVANLQSRFPTKTVAYAEGPAGNATVTVNSKVTKVYMHGISLPND